MGEDKRTEVEREKCKMGKWEGRKKDKSVKRRSVGRKSGKVDKRTKVEKGEV